MPAAIALLDSRTPIEVPPLAEDAGGYTTTVGAIARRALAGVTAPLQDHHGPTAEDGAAAWTAWWYQVLQTEVAPPIRLAPGRTVCLTALETARYWPELQLSPDGRTALIVATRLEKRQDGIRSGILWMPLDRPEKARFVYKVPVGVVNCEPEGLGAMWGTEAIGLVWHEYSFDPKLHRVRFLSLDCRGAPRGEAVDVPVLQARRSQLALAPSGAGWLLAWNDDRFGPSVQRLDATGHPLGKPVVLLPHRSLDNRWSGGSRRVSLAQTPTGFVLLHGKERGLFLRLLSDALEVTHTVRVDDPSVLGRSHDAYVCVGADTLCVAWHEYDNVGTRFLARVFGLDGTPRTGWIEVSDHINAIAPPAAGVGGFVLAWAGHELAPYQVSAAWLTAAGKVGPRVDLSSDRTTNWPLAAGLAPAWLRVIECNRDRWPMRILLRQVRRSVLEGN